MFENDLIVRRIIGVANCWQLKENLLYQNIERTIKVPKNFIFDFASVPLFFRRLFPINGTRYDRASCLHDWLYASHFYDRNVCDRIFYEAMRSDGVGKITAWIMYQAVRIGGFKAYKRSQTEINKIRELLWIS